MAMRRWPRQRPALAPGSASTMLSANTRASAIAHRDKFTRKACGYVDDRRCRPAALPPLRERARKAGKCPPSPTYTQAPQRAKELISTIRKVDSSHQPSPHPRSELRTKSAGLHLKERLRLSHDRGPSHSANMALCTRGSEIDVGDCVGSGRFVAGAEFLIKGCYASRGVLYRWLLLPTPAPTVRQDSTVKPREPGRGYSCAERPCRVAEDSSMKITFVNQPIDTNLLPAFCRGL
jgi:hypothetical protein